MLRLRPVLTVLAVLALGLGSAACNSTARIEDLEAADPLRRHAYTLEERDHGMRVAVGRQSSQLTPQMIANIHGFAGEAMRRGAAAVHMNVPSGAGDNLLIRQSAQKIRTALADGGVDPHRIVVRAQPAGNRDAVQYINLHYSAIRAVTPQCGLWPTSINSTLQNTHYENFGCSAQANLAAMISEPSDLVIPRAAAPVDQNRRSAAIESYRRGELTTSVYEEGLGSISGIGE